MSVAEAGVNVVNEQCLEAKSGRVTFNYKQNTELKPEVVQALGRLDLTGDGQVTAGELMAAADALQTLKGEKKFLRQLVALLAAVVVVLLVATFGLTIAAIEMSKEVHVKSGAMESGDMILQTKEAKATDIALRHAVVLDQDHLRSISEITLTLPTGVLSTGIVAVKKIEHEDEPPEVIFYTATNAQVRINVSSAEMVYKNQVIPLCGQLTCARFTVTDELDPAKLDAQLSTMVGEDSMRRLWQCLGMGDYGMAVEFSYYYYYWYGDFVYYSFYYTFGSNDAADYWQREFQHCSKALYYMENGR